MKETEDKQKRFYVGYAYARLYDFISGVTHDVVSKITKPVILLVYKGFSIVLFPLKKMKILFFAIRRKYNQL